MVRFLIQRPVAVLMSFLAAVVFSVLAFTQLPVSLLPDIDVPEIVITTRYANASPAEIEQNLLAPIREKMATLSYLEDVQSIAHTSKGKVILRFNYKAPMNLLYVEVNEKIDQLTDVFPDAISRPQVLRVNTSDIPIVRIQVVPKAADDYIAISELTERVLKKRLERLAGVSLIDINGQRQDVISIDLMTNKLIGLGMTENDVLTAVENSNRELGSLSVKDGQYRYYLRVASQTMDVASLQRLALPLESGNFVYLHEVANIQLDQAIVQGSHILNGQEGLVMTVHKQAQSNMQSVVDEIYRSVNSFEQEYPQALFSITQDQSSLLVAGISNLTYSLLFGGVFAFIVLFFFMENYQTPIIIGFSLPISMLISFLFFYFFDLSINIISLSGLALGIGMLIDNAIIVLDNIQRHQQKRVPFFESCIQGVNEVMPSLISAMLTTLAVFVPLIFLSGIGGALFYDQALSISIILSVSLLVAFVLLPLLYQILMRRDSGQPISESRLYRLMLQGYERLFAFCFSFKKTVLGLLILLVPLSLLIAFMLPIQGLPFIEKDELLLRIDWNEPIGVDENHRRTVHLVDQIAFQVAEADVGLTQFLLDQQDRETDQTEIYLLFDGNQRKDSASARLRYILATNYPQATIQISDAPNAFDQLFTDEQPYLEVRLKSIDNNRPITYTAAEPFLDTLRHRTKLGFELGAGFTQETVLVFTILYNKLSQYNIQSTALQSKLKQLFSEYQVGEIKRFGEVTPIVLRNRALSDLAQKLRQSYVRSSADVYYPLGEFVTYQLETDYQTFTSDRTGIYQSIILEEKVANPIEVIQYVTSSFANSGFSTSFSGSYFDDWEDIQQLGIILIVAVLLLYFILAAQFESLIQPLMVIATLPLGIGGALLLLLLTGSSINIMSAIGMIVALGILVNDSILKVDTINRLRKETSGIEKDNLFSAIHQSGIIRLKPIVMTSVTTILAVLPILFTSGIGSDLQRPLVISVIGGLTIGTFTALFFIPLAYWFLYHRKE